MLFFAPEVYSNTPLEITLQVNKRINIHSYYVRQVLTVSTYDSCTIILLNQYFIERRIQRHCSAITLFGAVGCNK